MDDEPMEAVEADSTQPDLAPDSTPITEPETPKRPHPLLRPGGMGV